MFCGGINHHRRNMMSTQNVVRLKLLLLALQFEFPLGLDADRALLLSFKYSILSDPLAVLETWRESDATPCQSWRGVTCGGGEWNESSLTRVVALTLPNCRLLGSIPASLGAIEYLRTVDLSNNSLNGSIPATLFQASELQTLDLSNNLFSGEVPVDTGTPGSLFSLNLSGNNLDGKFPEKLAHLRNLTLLSLRNNYISGGIPGGFEEIQVFDVSSNLISGSLPSDFGGSGLRYLNVSSNKLSGKIPPRFAEKVQENATIDVSFNNLTGEIPAAGVFSGQETRSFLGNQDLCGKPLPNPCPIQSMPDDGTGSPNSSPAIAAFPRPDSISPGADKRRNLVSDIGAGAIAGIVVGHFAGILLLVVIFVYVFKKKKKNKNRAVEIKEPQTESRKQSNVELCSTLSSSSSSSSESKTFAVWSCLRKPEEDEDDVASDSGAANGSQPNQRQGCGSLVTIDGEEGMDLESLFRASAYILGAGGSGIVYKAVMENGTAVAVRRIGDGAAVEKMKDFEAQVRAVAKLAHPNLVRVRGFYWGVEDKLVIYDYVPNGSLANARYRKMGSSPCPLPWEARLRIAKGVARGVAYLHDKKHVHGNLKPSNILLGTDMEPKIGDFGLDRLVVSSESRRFKIGGSMRNFGSQRSTASRESLQEQVIGGGGGGGGLGPGLSPSPSPSSVGCVSPYQAPESLRNLKPNPKWDVYSFGVVLLELLTGKPVGLDDEGVVEDRSRMLRMADAAIRADLEGNVETLSALLKLGFSCLLPVPQKRPSMKDALQVLEKIPSSPYTSYYY